MPDVFTSVVSLWGKVVEDLTLSEPAVTSYQAALQGAARPPIYKNGGFFVFPDLAAGPYDVALTGTRYQPELLTANAAAQPANISAPGANELIGIVRGIDAPNNRINFDPVICRRPIRSGAAVLTSTASTQLTTAIEPGEVSRARLATLTGIAVNDIVRIVREPAIRLKLSPYVEPPIRVTRLFGIAVDSFDGKPLAGAAVRITRINTQPVVLTNVAGASVATVTIAGTTRLLGLERDISAATTPNGHFHFYFERTDFITDITIEAALAAYNAATGDFPIPATRLAITRLELDRA